ncbi:MAG: RDD family protein [Thioalkalispiraceae bacterium]
MIQPASQASVHYAGFWRRLVALLLDLVLFYLVSAPFMYLMIGHDYLFWLAGNEFQLQNVSSVPFFLLDLVLLVCVFVFWITLSATPGKMVMGCQIVDANSLEPIRYKQALIRLLGYFVSALPVYLGFAWAAFDKRKQALHDKLANTLVVYQSDDYANQSLQQLQTSFFGHKELP